MRQLWYYILVLILLLCVAALASGAQGKPPLKPHDAALFERVVAPSRTSPQILYLLSPLSERPLDRPQIHKFLRSKALEDGGYGVIDEATKREALLQIARDKSKSPESQLVYHPLRARLRILQSFAKVSVARRMASPQSKSYCIQAMESGIDCMRDAARELEALEKQVPAQPNEVTSPELWEFHRRLLEIWDSAKRRDDLSLIRQVDLQALAEEVLCAPKK